MANTHRQSAETVVELAEHMSRLKSAASAFLESNQVRDRGYFSPSEDDQVTHLWISYHMARNALFEVVTRQQRAQSNSDQASLADFAIGFAAAAVLVDAGLFLRELFSEQSIVRRKLNESYELFGIPRRSFDAIQLSLSDPLHAVQLYQANAFYEQHLSELEQWATQDPAFGKVVQISTALASRLHVSPATYAKARANDRTRQLVTRLVKRGLGGAVYAVQSWVSEWIGQLSTKPGHLPALPDEIKSELFTMLKPGDVLVTRKEHSLTNYFLPGYWPHAAFYIGDGRVIEALADGVRERSVDSPFGVDAIVAIRPRLSDTQIEQAIERSRTHVGKPYDFDFDFTRADRMVCTEVVYRSFEGIGDIRFALTRRAGRKTLSAEDLLNMARVQISFRPLALFCPSHHDALLQDERIEEILHATVAS